MKQVSSIVRVHLFTIHKKRSGEVNTINGLLALWMCSEQPPSHSCYGHINLPDGNERVEKQPVESSFILFSEGLDFALALGSEDLRQCYR